MAKKTITIILIFAFTIQSTGAYALDSHALRTPASIKTEVSNQIKGAMHEATGEASERSFANESIEQITSEILRLENEYKAAVTNLLEKGLRSSLKEIGKLDDAYKKLEKTLNAYASVVEKEDELTRRIFEAHAKELAVIHREIKDALKVCNAIHVAGSSEEESRQAVKEAEKIWQRWAGQGSLVIGKPETIKELISLKQKSDRLREEANALEKKFKEQKQALDENPDEISLKNLIRKLETLQAELRKAEAILNAFSATKSQGSYDVVSAKEKVGDIKAQISSAKHAIKELEPKLSALHEQVNDNNDNLVNKWDLLNEAERELSSAIESAVLESTRLVSGSFRMRIYKEAFLGDEDGTKTLREVWKKHLNSESEQLKEEATRQFAEKMKKGEGVLSDSKTGIREMTEGAGKDELAQARLEKLGDKFSNASKKVRTTRALRRTAWIAIPAAVLLWAIPSFWSDAKLQQKQEQLQNEKPVPAETQKKQIETQPKQAEQKIEQPQEETIDLAQLMAAANSTNRQEVINEERKAKIAELASRQAELRKKMEELASEAQELEKKNNDEIQEIADQEKQELKKLADGFKPPRVPAPKDEPIPSKWEPIKQAKAPAVAGQEKVNQPGATNKLSQVKDEAGKPETGISSERVTYGNPAVGADFWAADVEGGNGYLADASYYRINPFTGQFISAEPDWRTWDLDDVQEAPGSVIMSADRKETIALVPPGYVIVNVACEAGQAKDNTLQVFYDAASGRWLLKFDKAPGKIRIGIRPAKDNKLPPLATHKIDETTRNEWINLLPGDIKQIIKDAQGRSVEERKVVRDELMKRFYYTKNPRLGELSANEPDFISFAFKYLSGKCDLFAVVYKFLNDVLDLEPVVIQIGYRGSGRMRAAQRHAWMRQQNADGTWKIIEPTQFARATSPFEQAGDDSPAWEKEEKMIKGGVERNKKLQGQLLESMKIRGQQQQLRSEMENIEKEMQAADTQLDFAGRYQSLRSEHAKNFKAIIQKIKNQDVAKRVRDEVLKQARSLDSIVKDELELMTTGAFLLDLLEAAQSHIADERIRPFADNNFVFQQITACAEKRGWTLEEPLPGRPALYTFKKDARGGVIKFMPRNVAQMGEGSPQDRIIGKAVDIDLVLDEAGGNYIHFIGKTYGTVKGVERSEDRTWYRDHSVGDTERFDYVSRPVPTTQGTWFGAARKDGKTQILGDADYAKKVLVRTDNILDIAKSASGLLVVVRETGKDKHVIEIVDPRTKAVNSNPIKVPSGDLEGIEAVYELQPEQGPSSPENVMVVIKQKPNLYSLHGKLAREVGAEGDLLSNYSEPVFSPNGKHWIVAVRSGMQVIFYGSRDAVLDVPHGDAYAIGGIILGGSFGNPDFFKCAISDDGTWAAIISVDEVKMPTNTKVEHRYIVGNKVKNGGPGSIEINTGTEARLFGVLSDASYYYIGDKRRVNGPGPTEITDFCTAHGTAAAKAGIEGKEFKNLVYLRIFENGDWFALEHVKGGWSASGPIAEKAKLTGKAIPFDKTNWIESVEMQSPGVYVIQFRDKSFGAGTSKGDYLAKILHDHMIVAPGQGQYIPRDRWDLRSLNVHNLVLVGDKAAKEDAFKELLGLLQALDDTGFRPDGLIAFMDFDRLIDALNYNCDWWAAKFPPEKVGQLLTLLRIAGREDIFFNALNWLEKNGLKEKGQALVNASGLDSSEWKKMFERVTKSLSDQCYYKYNARPKEPILNPMHFNFKLEYWGPISKLNEILIHYLQAKEETTQSTLTYVDDLNMVISAVASYGIPMGGDKDFTYAQHLKPYCSILRQRSGLPGRYFDVEVDENARLDPAYQLTKLLRKDFKEMKLRYGAYADEVRAQKEHEANWEETNRQLSEALAGKVKGSIGWQKVWKDFWYEASHDGFFWAFVIGVLAVLAKKYVSDPLRRKDMIIGPNAQEIIDRIWRDNPWFTGEEQDALRESFDEAMKSPEQIKQMRNALQGNTEALMLFDALCLVAKAPAERNFAALRLLNLVPFLSLALVWVEPAHQARQKLNMEIHKLIQSWPADKAEPSKAFERDVTALAPATLQLSTAQYLRLVQEAVAATTSGKGEFTVEGFYAKLQEITTRHGDETMKVEQDAQNQGANPEELQAQLYSLMGKIHKLFIGGRIEGYVVMPNGITVQRFGQGSELYELREHKPGDDMRKVNWRATAKTTGKLVIKETEADATEATGILVDLSQELKGGHLEQWLDDCAKSILAVSEQKVLNRHSPTLIEIIFVMPGSDGRIDVMPINSKIGRNRETIVKEILLRKYKEAREILLASRQEVTKDVPAPDFYSDAERQKYMEKAKYAPLDTRDLLYETRKESFERQLEIKKLRSREVFCVGLSTLGDEGKQVIRWLWKQNVKPLIWDKNVANATNLAMRQKSSATEEKVAEPQIVGAMHEATRETLTNVRPAQVRDLFDIERLSREIWRHAFSNAKTYESALSGKDKDKYIWVYYDKYGKVKGYILAVYYSGLKNLQIAEIAVDKAYRRQGIAKELFAVMMKKSRELGAQTLEIYVTNPYTEAVVREYGFKRMVPLGSNKEKFFVLDYNRQRAAKNAAVKLYAAKQNDKEPLVLAYSPQVSDNGALLRLIAHIANVSAQSKKDITIVLTYQTNEQRVDIMKIMQYLDADAKQKIKIERLDVAKSYLLEKKQTGSTVKYSRAQGEEFIPWAEDSIVPGITQQELTNDFEEHFREQIERLIKA